MNKKIITRGIMAAALAAVMITPAFAADAENLLKIGRAHV